MALNTYSNLKTSIANYLNRSDLTSYIPDFIRLAEVRMNKELRVREQEKTDTSITTVAGTQSYSLPTNFIEAKYVLYQSFWLKTSRKVTSSGNAGHKKHVFRLAQSIANLDTSNFDTILVSLPA